MAENVSRNIGQTAQLSRKAAGVCKIHGLKADSFYVITAHPATGEKIEASTDLVRPAMGFAVPDITPTIPAEW